MRTYPKPDHPRLSWNRPKFDREHYPDMGKSLFRVEDSPEPEKGQSEFDQVLQVISERFLDPGFTIEDVAKEMFMSTRQIQRVLNRGGSKGFHAEVRARRIDEACRKLTSTSKKLGEIAVECGYRQAENFSQIFTKEVGLAPTKYRKEMLGLSSHERDRAKLGERLSV